MPPNAVATNPRSSPELIPKRTDLPMRPLSPLEPGPDSTDSLFERVAWLYAFCRERLFRDDTERMISALWQDQLPPFGTKVVELGCGPGFYSRRLARRFPQIAVTGVDRSPSQIRVARQRAAAAQQELLRSARGNILHRGFLSESAKDSLRRPARSRWRSRCGRI